VRFEKDEMTTKMPRKGTKTREILETMHRFPEGATSYEIWRAARIPRWTQGDIRMALHGLMNRGFAVGIRGVRNGQSVRVWKIESWLLEIEKEKA
jgi:hypothetical protein